MADSQLIFEKYRLVKRIAIGGMGEIFLARQSDTLIDRFIILKSMLPDLAEDQTFVEQFLGEARVAATLNHPNIVSIYEVGAWEGIYYIAMEYIDGDDLTRLIGGAQKTQELISPVVAAKIILEAAIALEHAWLAKDIEGRSLNIVHRDISPQNIMLRRDGVVKVVDFGIARAANLVSRTQTGQVKGKLSYMPPEQLLGTKVDWRADQFSLGVVFWELVTCDRLIKPGTSHLELIETTTKNPMEDPRATNPSIPDAVAEIILKMGARSAEDRYENWSDIKSDLESFIRDEEQKGRTGSIADLQEKLLGEELDKKAQETTGSTPQNFMINLKTPGTVPLTTTTVDDNDEDEVATKAHELPKNSELSQKDTRVDSRPATQPNAQAVPQSSKPEVEPEPVKKKAPVLAIALVLTLVAGVAGIAVQQSQSTEPAAAPKAEAAAPQQIPLTIQVNGPVGATVSIDGNIIDQKAPAVLENLAHGEHRLILTKEGYPPIKQTVTLDGSVNPLIVNPALPPAFATLVLTSKPRKAGIYKDNILIGSAGETPLTLTPGETHHLLIKLPGYKPYKLSLAPKAGQNMEQKVILKRLKSKTKPKRIAAPQSAAPQPIPAAQPETIVQTKTIVIEDKLGYLTLRTKPWTNVFIDGKPYGPTPFSKRKLKAGNHSIKMERKLDDGTTILTTRTITIESGKTKKINWDLTP